MDSEIDQAMDFTYKLDRKSFQPVITNMDCKIGHTESKCRSLKNAITELKKENAKETVAHTTSIPASEKAEEEDSYEAVYVHTTEIVQPSVRRPSTLQPWCIRVDF